MRRGLIKNWIRKSQLDCHGTRNSRLLRESTGLRADFLESQDSLDREKHHASENNNCRTIGRLIYRLAICSIPPTPDHFSQAGHAKWGFLGSATSLFCYLRCLLLAVSRGCLLHRTRFELSHDEIVQNSLAQGDTRCPPRILRLKTSERGKVKVEILVVPGPVLSDLERIFESRGPPVHNWHGGRALVNGLDGAQLAVTSSRFSVDEASFVTAAMACEPPLQGRQN